MVDFIDCVAIILIFIAGGCFCVSMFKTDLSGEKDQKNAVILLLVVAAICFATLVCISVFQDGGALDEMQEIAMSTEVAETETATIEDSALDAKK